MRAVGTLARSARGAHRRVRHLSYHPAVRVDSDAELRLVVSEGILARTEAEALGREAAAAGQGLLARLEADGTITAARSASLRARIADATLPAALTDPNLRFDDPVSQRHRPPSIPTLDLRRSGRMAAVDEFPLLGSDRYRPVRLLGEGGMGRVFLVRDVRLERNVAIKFVRGDDAEVTRRVVAEARAQARVADERVCQVYEVGEIEGRVYIAMQHVDGQPLTELVHELTYEQKALVMRGAALGVHEAHRAGIIHRDLKPSNIMVERGPDGGLRPFVMDFGIARDWSDSTTATGTVLGTPQFMAPEQARGEVKQLDRRADVYSLGATMYALLVGRAPIEGDNPLVVLNRLSVDEPPRLRTIDKDIPPDLEAIVTKCLEKDRGARYESARALADDLGRFLDGAPVEARSAVSLGYRLRKTIRRYWRPLAVVALVVALAGVALGFGLRERWAGERRAALARRFTERVERIDALARYSALAPAHDLGRDRAQLRSLMLSVTDEMRAGGGDAEGPGRYALGRGHLALGDAPAALVELQAAWARGFHDPRVAYALALTEGKLYQRALRELERLPASVREQRRPEIERQYRDPARAHLLASSSIEVPSRAYVQALLAYYDGRFDDALRELDGVEAAAAPWFYEAPLLRGQILLDRATATRGRASDTELAAQLDRAREAMTTATKIGESEPSLFAALAELERAAMFIEMYGRGRVDEPYQRGLAAANQAVALEPDHVDALLARADLHRGMAEYRTGRGEDPADLARAAVDDARRALELAPQRPDARTTLASCYRQAGEQRQAVGKDPGAELALASAVLEAVPVDERDERAFNELGLIHHVWADYLDEEGQDASEHRRRAIEAYQGALARSDVFAQAWLNLGINYLERARALALTDPAGAADLDRAIETLERGRALQPQSLVPDFHQGDAYAARALRAAARGADPEPDRVAAIARYQHGLTINPDMALLHNGIAIVEIERGLDLLRGGIDPTAIFERAAASATRAIAVAPDQGWGYNNLSESWLYRAQWLLTQQQPATAAIDAAVAAIGHALAMNAEHPQLLLNAARIDVLRAQAATPRDRATALARARASLARAEAAKADSDGLRDVSARLATLAP